MEKRGKKKENEEERRRKKKRKEKIGRINRKKTGRITRGRKKRKEEERRNRKKAKKKTTKKENEDEMSSKFLQNQSGKKICDCDLGSPHDKLKVWRATGR